MSLSGRLRSLASSMRNEDRVRLTVGRWTEPVRVGLRARSARATLTHTLERGSLADARIVLVSVMRDDGVRLPFWLRYYRQLGVDHFVIIDNGSSDDTMHHLAALDSVSVYRTEASYRDSRYGIDWVNAVAGQRCRGKWVLFVDTDEFLVFDGAGERSLDDLVELLERRHLTSLQCLLIDMYGRNPVQENVVPAGADPFDVCNLFDGSGYLRIFDRTTWTMWVKGGVRGRTFFKNDLHGSPALNKTPLVRWNFRTTFVQSAHRLVPCTANLQSITAGLTGALLHQKFLASVGSKAIDSDHVAQHDPEYRRYAEFADASPFAEGLTRTYRSPADLVSADLISPIAWNA